MVQITIDNELKNKLLSSGEIVELRDASGKLLGRVFPEKDNPLEGMSPLTSEFSEEELKRRSEENGPTITTQELIARLKAKR